MPDLDDAAVERLAGICADLPPPGKPAVNTIDASLGAQSARYYATRIGLAGLASGLLQDRVRELAAVEWLLLSISTAARDSADGDWITALSDIGTGWVNWQMHEARRFQPTMEAVTEIVDREEGTA
jgi:hypothetical protein